MIAIDNILVDDNIVTEHFVCDLHKCKGGCCVDGDAGAPLEDAELAYLGQIYEDVKPYLTEEGKKEIGKQGLYVKDKEFGFVTPTIKNGMCAYGYVDKKGVVKCGIEKAFYDGKFTVNGKWKKPVSCHLFPIVVKKNSHTIRLDYEPRPGLCDPACTLGNKLKMPAFQFLKEPLIMKFGEDFFEALEATACYLKQKS